MTKRLIVVAEVSQRSINDAAKLPFQLLHGLTVFRQHHPAELERLADGLIDLRWTKIVGHPSDRIRVSFVFREMIEMHLCVLLQIDERPESACRVVRCGESHHEPATATRRWDSRHRPSLLW